MMGRDRVFVCLLEAMEAKAVEPPQEEIGRLPPVSNADAPMSSHSTEQKISPQCAAPNMA